MLRALKVICVKPFPRVSENRSNDLLQIIHSDVCGPVNKTSFGGARYFATFIDDYSGYMTVYCLKSKDEVFQAFKDYRTEVEKQTGKKIKCLRSDNGREYVNKDFDRYLRENGIKRQLTVPYTPQQNGIAERANRTLVEMARTMIVHSGVSEGFWAEAIKTSAYIRNRTTTKILRDKTPFEIWNGYKPTVGHFKIFGSKAIVLDKKAKNKFSAKSAECIMIGYSEESKAYRLYNTSNRRVIVARDVIFLENTFDEFEGENNDDVLIIKYDAANSEQEDENGVHREGESQDYVSNNNNGEFAVQCNEIPDDVRREIKSHNEELTVPGDDIKSLAEDQVSGQPVVSIGPGRPRLLRDGSRGRPRKLFNELHAMGKCHIETPENVEQAIDGPYGVEWQKSMKSEYDSLVKNGTWELANLPEGQVAIGCKWVYAVKRTKDGGIHKLKSRLVAKGCSQRYGVNYSETFSPVVRYANIRLVIGLAVEYGIHLHQLDVSSAYLNGDLHDTVYMKQPPYFEDRKNPGKVLRLKRSLYGLKQSGREWNTKLNDVLRKFGFTPCISDPCIYVKKQNGVYNIIVVYVDDLIVGSTSISELAKIKESLAREFEIVDGGELSYFLGMEFNRDGDFGPITISQKQYILDILEQYGMSDCKEVSTPLDPGFQVKCDNENCKRVDKTKYQSIIGTLMYLALSTRPDILLSVTKLSQMNCDPHSEHETACKHILRYLKKTADYKLCYKKTGKPIECFVDADWAGDANDRKSFSGYVFVIANCVFAWSARKQNVVSLSSTEAEYVAISAAATEAVYVRKMLAELHFPFNGPMTIYNDNQSAQCLVKNPTYHSRSKHIAIKYHHVRDMHSKGEIEVKYVSTNEMMSDILTKNLCRIKHCKFVNYMGLS